MDLAVVGYLLHDVLDVEGKVKECLGGVAAYTSLAASKLGLSVGIISKVRTDFKYFGQLEGIDLSGVSKQGLTTVFFNTYRNGVRVQRVANVGEQIVPEEIPKNYLKTRAIHLGPVFNEIGIETVKFLRQNSKAFITLDPQGFLRKEVDGKVVPKKMDYSILDFVDAVKFSEKELPEKDLDILIKKCRIVIATRSKKDSLIYFDGKEAKVPFFETNVVDRTGAGDVYMAGFIREYLHSKDPEKSAVFGAAAASFAVEGFGVSGIKGTEQIEERIRDKLKNLG